MVRTTRGLSLLAQKINIMTKENNSNHDSKVTNDWSSYFQLGGVFSYILRLFGKKDPNAPVNFNLKVMHGINKISIIMFVIALIVMVSRAIMRS